MSEPAADPTVGLRGPVVVTGTDTGVGKTMATAAIAAAAVTAGLTVAVVKPAQTGDDDDAAVVKHLTGIDTTLTPARFDHPMSPAAAAREAGRRPLALATVLEAVSALDHDLVLIEGAGGLLVPMGEGDWTVADLAQRVSAPAVVVTRGALGTLNHTALTLEALRQRAVPSLLVLGEFPSPSRRTRLERANLIDLTAQAARLTEHDGLSGLLPRVGDLPPERFRRLAPGWLAPRLHGWATPIDMGH